VAMLATHSVMLAMMMISTTKHCNDCMDTSPLYSNNFSRRSLHWPAICQIVVDMGMGVGRMVVVEARRTGT
jgi:tRNA G46 methylase TrmB